MRTITMRKTWVALALVASIIACKGESPTAPNPGPGPNPGPTPTPTGTQVTLTVSNTDPLVDSTVVATATVTVDGNPAANGTAVEFIATGGSYGTAGQSIVRTTTNGVASVTLTSSTAGPVEIRAIVNNIVRSATVTFRTRPVVDPPPSTAPSITAISPITGRPSGGETITITGRNFRSPVRVLFRMEDGSTKEAMVVSVSETQIQVMTPGINLGAGQQSIADVIVITEAGTANEVRIESTGGFTFRNTQLTPVISTITPNSGPVTGNTRVEIFGQGFQAPVQVLFGTAEARVITVDYGRIQVETPAGRDTSPGGSDIVTGPVDVTVRNITSQTSTAMTSGFHYKSDVQVIAVGPTQGPSTGGTQIEIIGHGFLAPVAVTVAGVAAQPTFVSGTKIIAITSGVAVEGCADVTGPVVVTNLANGDSDEGPDFIYESVKPTIIGVSPNAVVAGGSVSVTVANATPGLSRIKFGTRTVFASGTIDAGSGIGVFTATVPVNVEFDTEECSVGGVEGERAIPLIVDVTYEAVANGCTDVVTEALTILPADTSCQVPAAPEVASTPANGTCVTPATTTVGLSNNASRIRFTNSGTAPLTVSAGAVTGTAASEYMISPPNHTVAPGTFEEFMVTFTPTAAGVRTASVAFTTNDADEETITICLNGSGS